MPFVVLIFLVALMGCGGETSETTDASAEASPETSVDALHAEGCSMVHGLVAVGTDPEDGDVVSTCTGGEICGQTGGISGFVCCHPDTCTPALPEPKFDAAEMGDATRDLCDGGALATEPGIVESCCSGLTCAGNCNSESDAASCDCFGVAGGCGADFRCCALFEKCIPKGSGCHYGAK